MATDGGARRGHVGKALSPSPALGTAPRCKTQLGIPPEIPGGTRSHAPGGLFCLDECKMLCKRRA